MLAGLSSSSTPPPPPVLKCGKHDSLLFFVVVASAQFGGLFFASATGGGGGGAAAEPREPDGHDYAKIKSKSKPKFDQTKLEDFPQVTNQINSYWDSITPDQLVWCLDCPAIVVPERLHIFAKVKAPPDGVMAYGPRVKSVTPSRNREFGTGVWNAVVRRRWENRTWTDFQSSVTKRM